MLLILSIFCLENGDTFITTRVCNQPAKADLWPVWIGELC